MKPALLITRRLPDRVLAKALLDFEVTQREDLTPLTEAQAIAALLDYDAVLATLGDAFTPQAFATVPAPRAKIVANFGVGFNHISLEGARLSGVTVTNTPGAVTDATADIAMTLMLMTARRAAEGERLVRSGQWQGWQPTQMLGMHLTGKRLGILGMGRIGQAIAKRAHFGFNMQISYFNRSAKTLDLPATQVDSLQALLSQSDVVVIAVPGGEGTRHMLNLETLGFLQPHAILVNIARGDVIYEPALVAALQSGRIAGAGLDVYEFEPMVPPELLTLDNVTLLPHLGTATLEVREAMGLMALDNLTRFFAGEVPPNRLT